MDARIGASALFLKSGEVQAPRCVEMWFGLRLRMDMGSGT
jgi:hypothetical protein